MSLCPEGHTDCHGDVYLNNLALSLKIRFNYQGESDDLDETISLYEEALRLRPVGHESRDSSLDNLGGAFVTHLHYPTDSESPVQPANDDFYHLEYAYRPLFIVIWVRYLVL